MALIDIEEIQSIHREASAQREAAERAEATETAELKAIRERLIEGETTGDPLVDLVIIRNRKLDQEVVEMYYDLQERIAAHVGEPVLLVGRHEAQTS